MSASIPIATPPPHIAAQAALAPLSRRFNGPAFAALDLGTNNCRLLVGAPCGDGFRVLDSFSRIVRLGEGLHHSGRLSAEAMARAMEALHTCAARLARRRIRSVRAIATEACRRAVNGREFLGAVRRETGLDIAVISPREEAELALESCAPLLGALCGDRRALLFDIGGGSTELAWVRLAEQGRTLPAPQLIGYVSLPLGVVTLAERFGAAAADPSGYEAMVADVADRLVSFDRTHCIRREIQAGGVAMLGTSGTVTTLAGIALGLERYNRALIDGFVLTRPAAAAALAALRQLDRPGLAGHPCVGADRADFVLPGCAIFDAIRTLFPVAEVRVADRGLREGMLLRMMRGDRERPRRLPSAV
jgi:exopolyphosphatase/guanosine-5'-triphosphate,3'-diphosphate pyrophosphatase